MAERTYGGRTLGQLCRAHEAAYLGEPGAVVALLESFADLIAAARDTERLTEAQEELAALRESQTLKPGDLGWWP